MSGNQGREFWVNWDRMVKESKAQEENFHDMPDDNSIILADRKLKSLRSKLKDRDAEVMRLRQYIAQIELITLNNHDHDTIRINNICQEALR